MNNTETLSAPSNPAAEVPAAYGTEADQTRADSVAQFILVAKKWIPDERIRADLRVTPRGLFIHKDTLPVVMENYRDWLRHVAPHVDEPTTHRMLKRMFGTSDPELFYLIEPKRALIGYLIEAPLKNPAQLGLPVYLGSLEDARTRVHPRDPLVQCIPHLKAVMTPTGTQFEIAVQGTRVVFDTEILGLFGRLVQSNPRLRPKGFPEGTPALREVLRALIHHLGEARLAPENQRLLLPSKLVKDSRLRCVVHGALFFPLLPDGRIATVIDREGRNLMAFIRYEAAQLAARGGLDPGAPGPRGAAPRDTRKDFRGNNRRSSPPRSLSGAGSMTIIGGTFVPMISSAGRQRNRRFQDRGGNSARRPGRHSTQDTVGQFRVYGKSYGLSLGALVQFVRAVLRSAPDDQVVAPASPGASSAPPRIQSVNWKRFSVADCIRELGNRMVLAEPVEQSRAERFLPGGGPGASSRGAPRPRRRGRGTSFRMKDRWIFEISESGEVLRCLDKLTPNPN
jgi:hypothetical protein